MFSTNDIRTMALYFGWLLIPKYLIWFMFFRSRIKKYKNKHVGEKCIIIGNGPSLNNLDLSLLNNCNTIGLNKINLVFDKCFIGLKYHVAVNDLVIKQSIDCFDGLKCPSFLSYEGTNKSFYSKLFDKYIYILIGGELRFNEDVTYPMSSGSTVTYVAMQIAYYMGFDEVYLIGVDHNFQYNGRPHEKQVLEGKDVNHFDPNYFSGKEWQLPDLACSEAAFQLAHYYYRRSGRSIFDATLGGHLQVFPKVSYQEAVERCSNGA